MTNESPLPEFVAWRHYPNDGIYRVTRHPQTDAIYALEKIAIFDSDAPNAFTGIDPKSVKLEMVEKFARADEETTYRLTTKSLDDDGPLMEMSDIVATL